MSDTCKHSAPASKNSPVKKPIALPAFSLQILVLAVAYYLAGKLGLLFTLPTGYATAIWPSSGIALAGILILGYRVWPGILLGAFIVNFPNTLDTDTTTATYLSLVLPLTIAIGASIQATGTAFLIKRYGGYPNTLAYPREILSFLLLGGLIGCLSSATISVTALLLSGHIVPDVYWINWATWWAGDSMGVFIFTPLVLVWFQQPRGSWQQRKVTLTIPVLATFILTMALVTYGTRWEQDRVQFLFDEHALVHSNMLEKSLNSYISVVNSLQSFHRASDNINRQEFSIFAQSQLKSFPNLKGLSWNPLVPSRDRQQFEKSTRASGWPGFEITERDHSGAIIRATERPEYIPVLFIETLQENTPAIGFDVNSESIRRVALEQARDSAKPVVTSRIKLVQDKGRQYGVLIFMPVYDKEMPIETLKQRRQSLQGFMVAVLQIKHVLLDILTDSVEQGLLHRLIDDSASTEDALLYVDDHILDYGPQTLHGDRLIPGAIIFSSNVKLAFGEKQWRFEILAGKKFINLHRSENGWLILISGLFITGMLGAFVLIVTGRDNLLQSIVNKRNIALQESESNLKQAQRIAHIGSWQLDFSSNQLSYTEELYKMYGFDTAQPLPGLAEHEKLFTPESWKKLTTELEQTQQTGTPYELELERIHPDGTCRWMWVRGEALTNEEGEIVGLQGVAQDITDRKQTEKALNLTRFSIEAAGESLFWVSPEANIIDVNNAACQSLGYTREELLKMSIRDFGIMSRDTDGNWTDHFDHLRQQGSIKFEAAHLRKDGSTFPVEIVANYIQLENQEYNCAFVRDISERKERELALLASENLMRDLFEKAPLAYQSLDLAGNILEVNALWLKQTGYQREQVIGNFIGDYITSDSMNILASEFPKFQAKGKVDGPVFEMVRNDGSNFLWKVNGRIAKDRKGNSIRTHCMLTDVTERNTKLKTLTESEAHYRKLFTESSIVMLLIDPDSGQIMDANNAATQFYGYPLAELQSMNINAINTLSQEQIKQQMKNAEDLGHSYFEFQHRLANGKSRDVQVSSGPIAIDGKIQLLSTILDITKRKQAEAGMREALVVFNASSQGIMTTDAEGIITAINPAFSTITGYAPEEIIGKSPAILKSGRHDSNYYKSMWTAVKETGKWEGEIWNRRHNGEIYPQWQTITRVLDQQGQVVEYVALFSDITERKQQEEEIWHQANFDALTGLANRNLLVDRLERALAQARRNNNKVGLVFLDLDGFKWINDTLGHDVGDELLIEVANRISSTVRDQDTAARMGGDEFTVVIHDLNNMEKLRSVGEKLVGTLHHPFTLQGSTHQISGSAGITVYPDDGEDVQTLLKNADIAMYKAKQGGKNRYQFYSRHMQIDTQARMQMEADLRKAISANEFILHYQPIVDSDCGELVGAEALIRWIHPEKGLISPLDFIPVAEDSGLIVPIGEWVLREAVKQWSIWQQQGHPPLRLSVNVSSPQFREENFKQLVADVLSEFNVLPGYLVLEITESVLMDGSAEAEAHMQEIKQMGLLYALDDFGTGFSSLSYLKRFPVDIVKIDRSFINDCAEDRNDAHLVEAIVSMTHSLGLKVIAEGVETDAQYEFLRELGCDYIQGFLVSRPLPAETFELLIKQSLLLLPNDGASLEQTRFLAALRQDNLDLDDWLERLLIEDDHYLSQFQSNRNWVLSGIDLRQAIQNHLDWRRNLDDFISADTPEAQMTVENAGSCSHCKLGQWINTNQDENNQSMVKLEQAHRAFHHLAGKIVEAQLNGNRTLARRALTGITFRKVSRDVVITLIDCYRDEVLAMKPDQ